MPELPDLTLYAKNLRKQVTHKEITFAQVFNLSKVNATQPVFQKAMLGQRITRIDRDGKELFFALSNKQSFSVHLMLSGRFTLLPFAEAHSVNSKIICLGFSDGQALAVSDFSRMAKVTVNPKAPDVPDALSEAFSLAYFRRMAGKSKLANVKSFLTDQKIVRGIGNAYADEILYRALISPKSTVGKIPAEDLAALYAAIRAVLEDAIAQLERLQPDMISGEERGFLKVHNPKREATEEGEPIVVEEIAKRRTYYTKKQRLFF